MVGTPVATARRGRLALGGALLLGVAVAVVLGVYSRVHEPSRRALFLLGFSGILQMKTWLATLALLFVLVQLVTALWLWGRLPRVGPAPPRLARVHRWSGSIAFVISVPVVLHCAWSIGFGQHGTRLILHSVLGCAFYGAYASKMLGVRLRGLPGWALPVLGGATFTLYVLTWATSALWFLTLSDDPLF